jgi:hypothetical protein
VGLREAAVVVTAVAGEEGTRPLVVKVDPAVATVRDIKKEVEQAWGIPPEEQQLYRQPNAGGDECGEDEGSVAADNEGQQDVLEPDDGAAGLGDVPAVAKHHTRQSVETRQQYQQREVQRHLRHHEAPAVRVRHR